jgi:hypothetical protein
VTPGWQPVVNGRRRTEGAEAPRRQGATTENTGQHLRKEHRSRRGCIGGRMQPVFHYGLLVAAPPFHTIGNGLRTSPPGAL